MSHGFDTHRIFISAPGDLEQDRQTCHDVIALANETTAMPAKVLLIPVGLRENDQISSYRSIVSDNIRWSAFFIQIFEDDWGPRDLFRKLFLLATECRDDATMPMREVVVYLKDAPHESNQQIIAFRKELEERDDVRVSSYSGIDELREQLIETCNGWAREIIESSSRSNHDSEFGTELGSGADGNA